MNIPRVGMVGGLGGGDPVNVSSTHGVEIPHPNPSPSGRGAKTPILMPGDLAP